jgi:prepilin-type N-terminal cleavage/methylation domain-containing protein
MRKNQRGVTLTELMVAVVIMSTTVLAGIASFKYITIAIRGTRTRTIATNLSSEKMEVLKNVSYFQLKVTTNTAEDVNYNPSLIYDQVNYPPETIVMWGVPTLTRRVFVAYAEMSGTSISTVPATSNDTGLKQIQVYVTWDEGNDHKKIEVRNLYANPSAASLDAQISGTVSNSAGGTVASAFVQVIGSPQWKTYANSAGYYSFQVAHGTYAVSCASSGFVSAFAPSVVVHKSQVKTQNFTLSPMSSGTYISTVWISTSILISQVVASSGTVGGTEQEYIELYNPTTWTWNLNGLVDIVYREKDASAEVALALYPRTSNTSIAPGGYFLIASTNPVGALGASRTADALYDCTNAAMLAAGCPDILLDDKSGGVGIRLNTTPNMWLDRVSWSKTAAGTNCPASLSEGNCYNLAGGLSDGEEFVRKTSTDSSVSTSLGNAYDPDSSDLGFVLRSPLDYFPRNASLAPLKNISGKPAYSAYGTVDDGLSSAARAAYKTGTNGSPYALLSITNVSTGAWIVTISSSVYSQTIYNSSMSIGGTIVIPSSTTVSTWPVTGYPVSILTSSSTGGLIEGMVYGAGTAYNTPLASVLLEANGKYVRSNANGAYVIRTTTGSITVTANYNYDNPNYVTATNIAAVSEGLSTQVADFHLGQGGTIKGYVTSGTAALPDITVTATIGVTVFTAVSDQTGYFYISVATNSLSYELDAELDPVLSETSLPTDPLTALVDNPGELVFAGTFTVVGGMGSINGSVSESGSAITTGVLIIASTGTIADPPPVIYSSSAPAFGNTMFSGSSNADGTYSISVPAGSYNMSAYYPKVLTDKGTVSYSRLTKNAVVVTAGTATTGKDFSW